MLQLKLSGQSLQLPTKPGQKAPKLQHVARMFVHAQKFSHRLRPTLLRPRCLQMNSCLRRAFDDKCTIHVHGRERTLRVRVCSLEQSCVCSLSLAHYCCIFLATASALFAGRRQSPKGCLKEDI
eukprot:6480003-Amphidinium_carterae.2